MSNISDRVSQPRPRSSVWRRSAVAASLVASGFVLGAVTLASADGGMPWPHHGHHGLKVGMIQHVVQRALDNVGATTAQENKIHDIIAATSTDLDQPGDNGREAMRKQVLALMAAPTLDRGAIEKLRADQIAAIDAKSKKIVGAMLDAAGELTPAQRTKLAQQVGERMAHGGWGGWHHHDGQMNERGGGTPDGAPQRSGDHADHG